MRNILVLLAAADHAEDIVMFDVPPPNEVPGKPAYRDTWTPFFKWQKQRAAFEIVSLDVTAGNDVAFAHGLLRCGTVEELEKNPENRLRLTISLRKMNGRWAVAHEEHSWGFLPNRHRPQGLACVVDDGGAS